MEILKNKFIFPKDKYWKSLGNLCKNQTKIIFVFEI